MKFLGRVIIAAILVCGYANKGVAGVVNNAGTASQEDSLRVSFVMLDSLGNPESVTSGDSMWIYVFYPGDDLAAADSIRLTSETDKLTTRRLKFRTKTADYFAYTNSVANLDGSGVNGTYKYIVVVGDSACCGGTGTAPMITTYHGEFQLVTHGNYASILDSAAVQAQEIWTATGGDSVLQALDYTNNTHEVARQVASTIDANITQVGGDAITDNGDGRLEVNVEEWRDVAPLALVTDGAVIAVIDSTTAAGGAGTMDAAEMEAINRDIIGDTFNVVNGNVYSDVQEMKNGVIASATFTTGAIGGLAIADDAFSSSELHGSAAREIADSIWKAGVKGMQAGDADSTFADAFVNTSGQAHVIINIDSSAGTLADAQADEITVNIKADDTVTVVNNVLNINSADTLQLVNNVGNIPSTDTIAVVNNVLNINSADTLARVNSTDAGDTIRSHAPHGNNWASTAAGSGNDSLQIRRWVWDSTSSKYWGGVGYKRVVDSGYQVNIKASDTITHVTNKVTLVDSSANDIAVMGNYHPLDSTYQDEMHDSLDTQGWAATAASSLDSAVVSRIVRRMWGIQLGAAGSTDSTTLSQRTVFVDSVQADAINDNAITDGAIDYGGELDTTGIGAAVRKVVGDSLSGLVYAVSELQAFFGACDECYYRLFPEGGTANKDSAIVIDGSIATSDSLLGKIIYKHGTVNAVYDTAFFYTRPWW